MEKTEQEDPGNSDHARPVQRQLLEQALEAASKGRADEAVEKLFTSYAVDGLFRRLRCQWVNLSAIDVDLAVAQAVEVLLRDLRAGKKVFSPLSYLYKVANNKATDLYREQKRLAVKHGVDEHGIPIHTAPEESGAREKGPLETLTANPVVEDGPESRALLVKKAKELLPRIGEGNILAVGEFIINAVADGYQDITRKQVGEALGISGATVGVTMGRFWERMEREAKRAGLVGADFSILAKQVEEDGDDEPEEPEEDDLSSED